MDRQIRFVARIGAKEYSSVYDDDLYMAEVLRNLCVNLGMDFDMKSGILTNVVCSIKGANSQGVAQLIPLQYKEFDDVKKVIKVVRALELKSQRDDQGVQVIVVELGFGLPPPFS